MGADCDGLDLHSKRDLQSRPCPIVALIDFVAGEFQLCNFLRSSFLCNFLIFRGVGTSWYEMGLVLETISLTKPFTFLFCWSWR